MSRRQHSSKDTNSRHQQQHSSFVANLAHTGLSDIFSDQLRTLAALALATILMVVGGYYYFKFEPPVLAPVRQSATDVYRVTLSADPENHNAHYNLGLMLQSQGKTEEAISHYRKAIAIKNDDARYHNNLGAALAATGKLDEAIDHFNLAIEFDPNNSEVRFNLGNALFSHEKPEDAMFQYRRAIQLKPDYAKAHNNLAVVLKKTGRLKEAYQHRYEAMRLERSQQGAE